MAKSGIKSSVISKGEKSPSPARSKARSATSSHRGRHEKTSEESIIIVSRYDNLPDETDWVALHAMTDEQITEAVRNDPDAVPFDLDWSDGVFINPAKKKAISIRIDEDVLAFFKDDGPNYQGRMNAVLRSYMLKVRPPKKPD